VRLKSPPELEKPSKTHFVARVLHTSTSKPVALGGADWIVQMHEARFSITGQPLLIVSPRNDAQTCHCSRSAANKVRFPATCRAEV
jgi:hypothetical protein